jgi:phage terminase small subunit
MSNDQKNKNEELTQREEKTVYEYLVDLNIKNAAIRAGFAPKYADRAGWRALQKPAAQKLLQELWQQQKQRWQMRVDDVVAENTCIAQSDVRKIFDNEGAPVSPNELPEEIAKAVSGVEVIDTKDNEGNVVQRKYKYRFWDKNKALEWFGKYYALFTENRHHTGKIDFDNLPEEQLDDAIAQAGQQLGYTRSQLAQMGLVQSLGGESEAETPPQD